MFNPHQATEDRFALNLCILFFVSVLIGYSLYLHYDSALKYWLLKGFGETTIGTVISVERAWNDYENVDHMVYDNPRNFLKNVDTWIAGDRILVEYKPPESAIQILILRIPSAQTGTKVSSSLQVAYLPSRPQISHPTAFLDDFAFDSKVLLASIFGSLIVALLGAFQVRAWKRFRLKQHRY